MDQGLIINTAFTGAVSDNSRNSNVPYSTEEIVADTVECVSMGTSMGHFHVRDENGHASCDDQRYGELFESIRNTPQTEKLIIIASTSGRHGQTLDQRAAVLKLPAEIRPDMASLTLSSLNFQTGASVNQPDDIRALAAIMLENDIKPELEIFDLGMVTFARQLIHEGLVEAPYYFNFILGNIAGADVSLLHIAALVESLPDESVISIGAIGKCQLQANTLALGCAHGVRVGLEDNLWMDKNKCPATNAMLTERISRMATIAGRAPIGINDARSILCL